MNNLHKIIIDATKDIPIAFLKKMLREKITNAGKIPDEEMINKLVDHIREKNSGTFQWGDSADGPEENISISFSKEDIDELDKKTRNFIKENLPEIIVKTAEDSAKLTLATLNKNWIEQYTNEKIEKYAFEQRLELRWGNAFKKFRMLLTISREIGVEKYEKFIKSNAKKNRYKNEVIHQLYGRACRTMSEIERLLSGGYADGALARWRTLHEIYIISEIISSGNDDLAERYLAHEIVENRRAHKVYEESHKHLSNSSSHAKHAKIIEKEYLEATKKYGQDFKNEYGWASALSNKSSPNFTDLEKLAGQSRMRSHYKLASYMVHASVKGIRLNLGLLRQEEFILTGASNAGLEEAGTNSILTMGKMAMTLFHTRPNFDELIKINIINIMVSQGISEFIKARKKLVAEENSLYINQ